LEIGGIGNGGCKYFKKASILIPKLLQLGGVTKCITIVYGIKSSIDPRNTKRANPWPNLHIRL